MNSKRNITFPRNFRQTSKLYSNKRSSQASFIQLLPGFALKVIASHLLVLKPEFINMINENTLENNSDYSIFNFQLNRHNYKSISLIMQSNLKTIYKIKFKGKTK